MTNTQQLAGKTAHITGSARGIGRGFAERFVRDGARVAITDIDLDAAQPFRRWSFAKKSSG